LKAAQLKRKGKSLRFSGKAFRVFERELIEGATWKSAKSVLDAGWGLLKAQLQYKGQQAGRSVIIVSEKDSTRTCNNCKALTGPKGLDMLAVRIWVCSACGDTHDREVNSARNHRAAGRSPPSVSGNEQSLTVASPSQTSSRCETGISALKAAA